MKIIKMFKKFLVFIGFFFVFLAQAGSYDDFFKAVSFDDVKTVQSLLQRGFDPNTVDSKARPALILAIQEPSPKVAELLIQWPGTQIHVRNPAGETPLMLAALRGQVPLVEMLIEKKAAIHHPGWSPLHYAATGGHTAIVDLLIKRGAAVNAESPNGTTPLMMAARYGSAHSVKSLIQSGSDLLKQNQQGLTAFDFAVQGGLPDNEALMRQGLARLKIYPPTQAR
ncbi:MAG: ankyrin repeat domain-containing protein [Limnohabitans sp.]|nr:ankyrin repeat domain-containing protein [Limnohabitans sp.]